MRVTAMSVFQTLFFLGMWTAAAAQTDLHWSDQSRLIGKDDLSGIAWTGSRYVAVGDNGTILTSQDGIAWQAGDSVTPGSFNWVIWTGTQVIAFSKGKRPTWVSSPDGAVWSSHTIPDGRLNASVWTGSQIVAAGDSGAIESSSDLKTWTNRVYPVKRNLRAIVWTGTRIVAVGDSGAIVTSTNLKDWSAPASPTTGNLLSVLWTGTVLAALDDAGMVFTSQDGTAWTASSPVTNDITNIVWTGALLVATGPGGLRLTSPDGITWTEKRGYPGIGRVVHGDNLAYAIGIYDTVLYTSADGVSWTSMPAPTGSGRFNDLTFSNGRLVIVGDSLTVITVDSSGATALRWKGAIPELYRVARTSKGLVAVGDKGAMITSLNGIAWQRYSVPTQFALDIVASTDSLFVVSDGSGIYTSPDGISWTKRNPANQNLNDIVWSGNQLVMVGFNGCVLTSPDGITWTGRNSNTTDNLTCIGWSGKEYMAGTSSTNCVYTSLDGVAWTKHARGGQTATISSIASSGSVWAAVGDDMIFSSADAVQWKAYDWTSYLFEYLYAVVWTGDEFVAAGNTDSVYVSPDGSSCIAHYSGEDFNVGSMVWADSLFVAVGLHDDKTGALMCGKFFGPNAATRPVPQLRRANQIRPRLYNSVVSRRYAGEGWIYTLDGRRVMRFYPESRGGGFTPGNKTAHGIWALFGGAPPANH